MKSHLVCLAFLITGTASAAPEPTIKQNGGYTVTMQIQDPAPPTDACTTLALALRKRTDPASKRGVEFTHNGKDTVNAHIPNFPSANSAKSRCSADEQKLADAGLPVDRLYILAMATTDPDANVAASARKSIEEISNLNPMQANAIKAFIRSATAYLKQQLIIDSAEDFTRSVVTSGNLEFRIGAAPGEQGNAQTIMVNEAGTGLVAPKGLRWCRIRNVDDWVFASAPAERASLRSQIRSDPVGFFAKQRLAAHKHRDRIFILLRDTPETTLTRSQPNWSVQSASTTPSPDPERLSLTFTIDPRGGELLKALTQKNPKQPLAFLIDDEVVFQAGTDAAAATSGAIPINLEWREARRLAHAISTPLPFTVKIKGTEHHRPTRPN